MKTTNELFCTREQGKRLKNLVPELKSGYMWVRMYEKNSQTLYWVIMEFRHYEYSWQHRLAYPALTLQELRDVIWHIYQEFQHTHNKEVFDFYDFESNCKHATASEFAAWVIERLE